MHAKRLQRHISLQNVSFFCAVLAFEEELMELQKPAKNGQLPHEKGPFA